jgi:hypothetical protein
MGWSLILLNDEITRSYLDAVAPVRDLRLRVRFFAFLPSSCRHGHLPTKDTNHRRRQNVDRHKPGDW